MRNFFLLFRSMFHQGTTVCELYYFGLKWILLNWSGNFPSNTYWIEARMCLLVESIENWHCALRNFVVASGIFTKSFDKFCWFFFFTFIFGTLETNVIRNWILFEHKYFASKLTCIELKPIWLVRCCFCRCCCSVTKWREKKIAFCCFAYITGLNTKLQFLIKIAEDQRRKHTHKANLITSFA